ncbi:MAG TPA: hypothetical protein VL738_42105 [Dactylosporangium sp.]|nr:hypothetical protein [Dactylosporangium sp.]
MAPFIDRSVGAAVKIGPEPMTQVSTAQTARLDDDRAAHREGEEAAGVDGVDERDRGAVSGRHLGRVTEAAQHLAHGGLAVHVGGLLGQQCAQLERDVGALPAREEADDVGHVSIDELVRRHGVVSLSMSCSIASLRPRQVPVSRS